MVVKQFKGRGRRATLNIHDGSPPGGWLFRLYMAWFGNGLTKR